MDLPRIVDEFAQRFDELPEAVAGVSAVRMLVGVGALAAAYVVHGAETTTGAVERVMLSGRLVRCARLLGA